MSPDIYNAFLVGGLSLFVFGCMGIWSIAGPVLWFTGLYYAIKLAVRDGVKGENSSKK